MSEIKVGVMACFVCVMLPLVLPGQTVYADAVENAYRVCQAFQRIFRLEMRQLIDSKRQHRKA